MRRLAALNSTPSHLTFESGLHYGPAHLHVMEARVFAWPMKESAISGHYPASFRPSSSNPALHPFNWPPPWTIIRENVRNPPLVDDNDDDDEQNENTKHFLLLQYRFPYLRPLTIK